MKRWIACGMAGASLCIEPVTGLRHSCAQPPSVSIMPPEQKPEFAGPAQAPPERPWQLQAGNPSILKSPENGVSQRAAAFSSDGSLLATAGGVSQMGMRPERGTIFLWDMRNNALAGELRGANTAIQRVLFSPDGKLLATQSGEGLMVWDVAGRKLLHRLNEIRKLAPGEHMLSQPRLVLGTWSPDSKLLAANEISYDLAAVRATQFNTVKLFSAVTGQLARTYESRMVYLGAMGWTPNGVGLLIATRYNRDGVAAGSAIEYLEIASGKILGRAARSNGVLQQVREFSTDRRYAVLQRFERTATPLGTNTSTNQRLAETTIWDLANDRAMWSQDEAFGTPPGSTLSPDNHWLVSGNADGETIIRDAATGEVMQKLPAPGCEAVYTLAVSPDSRRIVNVDNETGALQLWNLDAPYAKPLFNSQTVLREVRYLRALNWSGGQLRMILGATDDVVGTQEIGGARIESWNPATGESATALVPDTHVMACATASPDGKLLAMALGSTAVVTKVGVQPFIPPAKVHSVAIFDLTTGALLRTLPEMPAVSSLVWSPDGKFLATSAAGIVTLWSTATGAVHHVLAAKAEAVAWSPDGRTLATGSSGGQVQLFDARLGTALRGWKAAAAVRGLAYSPDGKKVAVGAGAPNAGMEGAAVWLYEAASGRQLQNLPTLQVLRDLHWAADGRTVMASSSPGGEWPGGGHLRAWDAATGAERFTLNATCGITEFALSPDGRHLAAYTGKRIRVWDLK